MTSIKKNSIETLVDSILLQQEQCRSRNHEIDVNQVDEPSQRKPFTFLIQHTQSFMTRYNENDNNYYYRQHSQHQPQVVPWKLQSGELWLDYLAHLILQPRSTQAAPSAKLAPVYSQANVSDENRFKSHQILFLSTLPITSTSAIQGLRTKYGTHRVPSISCGRLGSLMDDFNNHDQQKPPQRPPLSSQCCDIERLDTIVSAVKDRLSSSTLSTTTCAIFIDSITPILIRHGYLKLMHFLQQLMQVCSHNKNNGKLLLVIPIRVEMFTFRQQSVLEQRIAFDAILNAEVIPLLPHQKEIKVTSDDADDDDADSKRQEPQFTVLFIRRGVPSDRRDYIRRDTISYQVKKTTVDHDVNDQIQRRYGIVICNSVIPDRTNVPTLEGDIMPLEEMAGQISTLSLTSTATKAAVPLQLDDGTRRFPPTTTTPTTPNMNTKKPNIYLEENDPDYYDHDFDEDEPDDDLDL